ncbi:Sister chromatid cohesion protein 2 [Lobulomyces angularis]|nr:Sister chromatid cohesion protein 2 [Lobulomyces angularis]
MKESIPNILHRLPFVDISPCSDITSTLPTFQFVNLPKEEIDTQLLKNATNLKNISQTLSEVNLDYLSIKESIFPENFKNISVNLSDKVELTVPNSILEAVKFNKRDLNSTPNNVENVGEGKKKNSAIRNFLNSHKVVKKSLNLTPKPPAILKNKIFQSTTPVDANLSPLILPTPSSNSPFKTNSVTDATLSPLQNSTPIKKSSFNNLSLPKSSKKRTYSDLSDSPTKVEKIYETPKRSKASLSAKELEQTVSMMECAKLIPLIISEENLKEKELLFSSPGILIFETLKKLQKHLNKVINCGRFTDLVKYLNCGDLDVETIKASKEQNLDETKNFDVALENLKKLCQVLFNSIRESEYLDISLILGLKKIQKNLEEVIDLNSKPFDFGNFDKINNGVLASSVILTLIYGISGEKFKHFLKFYSEDTLLSLINLLKTQLMGSIIGVLNPISQMADDSKLKPIKELYYSKNFKFHFKFLIQLIEENLNIFFNVIDKEFVSDDIIIPLVFISLSPFFTDPMFASDLDLLQNRGINLLRLIFCRNSTHRSFILEEIISNLTKTTNSSLSSKNKVSRYYKLADGKSVQMVSALIFQLIQSISSSEESARLLLKKDLQELKDSKQSHILTFEEKLNFYKKGQHYFKGVNETCSQFTAYFLKTLISKILNTSNETKDTSKKRGQHTTSESEYKIVLENFMDDCLNVLNQPEFPCAENFCMIISYMMINHLEDKKTDSSIKSLTIEWLGKICSIIRTVNTRQKNINLPSPDFKGLNDSNLSNLTNAHKNLLSCNFAKPDISTLLAITNTPETKISTQWDMRSQIVILLEGLASRQPLMQSFEFFMSKISNALDNDVVHIRSKALKALQDIVLSDFSYLEDKSVRQMIEFRLLDNSSSVRDAATELLGKIVTGQKMTREIVHEYYEMLSSRILDIGTSVRKRIIKILRDIFLSSLEAFNNFVYTTDKKDISSANADKEMMVDILLKLLSRLDDEETTVQDMTMKVLNELIFGDFQKLNPVEKMKEIKFRSLILIEVCFKDTANFNEYLALFLKEFFIKEEKKVEDDNTSNIDEEEFKSKKKRSSAISNSTVNLNLSSSNLFFESFCGCLIDLVLNFDREDDKEGLLRCLNLILQLSKYIPNYFSKKVTTLYPYMKLNLAPNLVNQQHLNKEEKEKLQNSVILEQIITENVVKIFINILPSSINDVDITSFNRIESDLIFHINKGNQNLISCCVPCLCVIVEKITKQYKNLLAIFNKCIQFLKRVRNSQSFPVEALKSTIRSILVVSMICRHLNLEKLKVEFGTQLNEFEKGCILTTVYNLINFFAINHSKNYFEKLTKHTYDTLRSLTLFATGQLYIAYPTLMLRDDARFLMNSCFDSDSATLKNELIKIFVDFLLFEQEKSKKNLTAVKNEVKKEIDIQVLIGNSDELGEAGVSSSIMQLYLERILHCILNETDHHLNINAFDLIKTVLEHGLVHPVLCVPAIVAMESCPDAFIKQRATLIHKQLNEKHQSIIHGKIGDCVKTSFEYQLKLIKKTKAFTRNKDKVTSENSLIFPQGFQLVEFNFDGRKITKPEASLCTLYSILQEKKQKRNEFLSTLVNYFDVPDLGKLNFNVKSLPFNKYLADNLATFYYKTTEEVLHVLYHLYKVVSVTAESCLEKVKCWESGVEYNLVELSFFANVTVSMGLLLILKLHLQKIYQISEIKRQSYYPNNSIKATEKVINRLPNSEEVVIEFEKEMPFCVKEIENERDMWDQLKQFAKLMNEFTDAVSVVDVSDEVAEEVDTTIVIPEKKKLVGKRKKVSTSRSKKRKSYVVSSDEEDENSG